MQLEWRSAAGHIHLSVAAVRRPIALRVGLVMYVLGFCCPIT